jgi:hypothetical protein
MSTVKLQNSPTEKILKCRNSCGIIEIAKQFGLTIYNGIKTLKGV